MTLNITVFGGHGFIGRHVVQRLAKRGDLIRVAARRPESGHFLKPLGNVGQIVPIQANVRDELSIKKAVSGADAVINLVGILREQGRQTFKDVHERAPRLIASAAAESGVKHFVHLSAIGADTKSPSLYGKSKALGELALFEAFPTATILRPSIIFGPDDEFFNKMAALIAILPFVPIFFDTFKFPKISFNGIFPNIDFNAGITNF